MGVQEIPQEQHNKRSVSRKTHPGVTSLTEPVVRSKALGTQATQRPVDLCPESNEACTDRGPTAPNTHFASFAGLNSVPYDITKMSQACT